MTRPKRKSPQDTIDGPAVITPDHVRNRTLAAWTGSKKGWSRLADYEKAYNRGTLMCRENCTSPYATQQEEARARDRFAAARDLDLGWQRCQAPFPHGVEFDRIRTSGGGGTPGAFVDHARDAKDFWHRVELAMSANDWRICRMACAEGYTIAQAVMAVSPVYRSVTQARFREALDALVEGMHQARTLCGK